MGSFRRVSVIAGYEWKRAWAKKSLLALVILAVVIQTLIILTDYGYSRSGITFFGVGSNLIWIYAVLGGGSEGFFFVQLIAIIIAGGSMSEEYEHGTADILLSKPISRIEYLFGKFLGGFSLLAMIEALITFVGVVLSFGFFGAQSYVQFAPLLFFALAYSSLIFFCLSFMFSEVFRGTTLAILLAFAIFIASSVIGSILSFMNGTVARAVPTWAATNFPGLMMSEMITAPGTSFLIPAVDTEALYEAALIVAVYAAIFFIIAALRILKSDVTKKKD
jgi:ABC-2 type transport system permease protein